MLKLQIALSQSTSPLCCSSNNPTQQLAPSAPHSQHTVYPDMVCVVRFSRTRSPWIMYCTYVCVTEKAVCCVVVVLKIFWHALVDSVIWNFNIWRLHCYGGTEGDQLLKYALVMGLCCW